jgi:hypothetical protein
MQLYQIILITKNSILQLNQYILQCQILFVFKAFFFAN